MYMNIYIYINKRIGGAGRLLRDGAPLPGHPLVGGAFGTCKP